MDHGGNQSNGTTNMKNVNFVPKGVQKIYHHIKFRKSIMNSEVFYKKSRSVRKGVLRNFAKFTGKHLCQSPLFNTVAGCLQIYLKKTLTRCFPVNFAKFLRIHFL